MDSGHWTAPDLREMKIHCFDFTLIYPKKEFNSQCTWPKEAIRQNNLKLHQRHIHVFPLLRETEPQGTLARLEIKLSVADLINKVFAIEDLSSEPT